ncbi:MAG: hypothetical protein CMC51_03250 [Flavobacteriaceae bacterium]|nr:hypothetical protein [Flavobacteriaceae bacterium]
MWFNLMNIYNIIIVFTSISFIAYGVNSFISNKMILEFRRWGLEKRRKEIGSFQLACGIGILIGLKLNTVLIFSSAILIIMMLVAVYVRLKIKDNISEILPALAYLILGIIILQHTI